MDSTLLPKDNMEFRKNLNTLRQTHILCDGNICIPGENRTLPVHRAVMSTCSEFFRSLFTNGLQETMENNVTIHGVSLKMMETIIEYAYTKEVTITTANAEDIFIAADRFNVLGLLQECINFLVAQLSPENCVGLLRFARFYNNKELEDMCWVYIMSHFRDIIGSSTEFEHLNYIELMDIISSDTLNVSTEDEVFDAVMRWTEFSPRERKEQCNHLLGAVRFAYVSEDCFRSSIVNRRDLKRGPCWQRISQSYSLVKRFRSSKDRTLKSRTKELAKWVRPRVPSHVIFVLGGWANDVTDSVETYDKITDQWFEITPCELPHPRAYHGTVTIQDKIYVAGGYYDTHYLKSVLCFDVSKKKWEEKQHMQMARCYVSVVSIGDIIYACGGFDGLQRHKSVERYERNRNHWTLVKPMYHKRSDAGAASLRGKLYIAGGFDGEACLLSAEMYDPDLDQWTVLASMSVRRSGVSLVSCDDRIFAIGGYDGERRLDSVEYFDDEWRTWNSSVSMLLGRSNFSSVVMEDRIYVIGGYDGTITSPKVECYCPQKRTWHALNDMNVGRSAASACAVTDIYNARDYSFHGNEELTSSEENLTRPTSVEENTKYAKTLARWRCASKH